VGATALCAAPPEGPAPAKAPPVDAVEFPREPAAPPAPVPNARLGTGQVYDIRARVDVVVRAYPPGLVRVTKDVVPAGETLRAQGDFTDGAKTHIYKGPLTVYKVEPLKAGTVQLVVTPLGLKSEADIKTVALDVLKGPGPNPPGPTPEPGPGPVTSFRVFLVFESGAQMTAAQQGVFYGSATEAELNKAVGTANASFGWRRLDRDADPAKLPTGMREAWTAARAEIKPGNPPCVVFQVNEKITIEPLPATDADAAALVTKYRGK
jgi:hypothetical protein